MNTPLFCVLAFSTNFVTKIATDVPADTLGKKGENICEATFLSLESRLSGSFHSLDLGRTSRWKAINSHCFCRSGLNFQSPSKTPPHLQVQFGVQ